MSIFYLKILIILFINLYLFCIKLLYKIHNKKIKINLFIIFLFLLIYNIIYKRFYILI